MVLPPKGLIVSCYLESMKGCEKDFIASVVKNKHVVGLRVEGLDNIRYARMLTDKFIIGLVKRMNGGMTTITPTIEDYRDVLRVGADMVASGECVLWKAIPENIMIDLCNNSFDVLVEKFELKEFLCNHVILATTYENKGYDLLIKIKEMFPEAKVNLEGGLMTREDIQKAFELGADWVTIGKAINDPPTIINYLMEGVL